MADTYILVDATDTVVNSALWDGDLNNWAPPAGLRAFRYDGVWHDGYKWDGAKAYDPNPPPPEPEIPASAPPSEGMTVI